MSAVDAKQEQAVVEALDFEHEPECQAERVADGAKCGDAASWLGVCQVCGDSAYLCGVHKASTERVLSSGSVALCTSKAVRMTMAYFPIGGTP